MIGLPKSAIDSMKPTRKTLVRPGLSSGSVTVVIAFIGLARKVCAASSSVGATAWTTLRIIRNAIGVKANICASQIPCAP